MKKRLIYTASIIALLTFAAGCGEDERGTTPQVDEQQELTQTPIGFSHSRWNDDPASRSAGDVTTDNISQMTVYAHYTETDDFTDVILTTTPDVMLNQSVTRNITPEGPEPWEYWPTKYWPTAGQKLSFFAITYGPSPANGVALAGGNSYTGYPAFKVTPLTDPSAQKDIGVASALNRTRDDDNGAVPLTFKHAMAKVRFAAWHENNSATYSDKPYGIAMREITLSGIYNSATLHLTASGYTWDAPETSTSNYTLYATDVEIVPTGVLLKGESANPEDAVVSTDAGMLMLVPQTTPTDAELTVTYWSGRKISITKTAQVNDQTWKAGEVFTFNMTIPDDNGQGGKLSDVLNTTVWNFPYTGAVDDFFVIPQDGTYKLEAWGAGGGGATSTLGLGGFGGYAAGELNLKRGQILYIYTGQSLNTTTSTFNGGGAGVGNVYAGGGATDIRLLGGAWDNAISLNSRILVAGAGGGYGRNNAPIGGGGGLTGYAGGIGGDNYLPATGGKGGEQTKGGAGGVLLGHYTSVAGSFGKGSDGQSDALVGGGGGGYYGGSGAVRQRSSSRGASGGGGSSFISGMAGCVAIDPAYTNNPRTQDAGSNKTALNYSNSVFGGASPTWGNGEEIVFSNPSMIDGQGYQWNTGAKAGSANGMPNHANPGATMTGNTGNGYARITLLTPATP